MAEKDLSENPFRDEIYDYLLSHGYVAGQKADYDYKHALDVGKLFTFLEATQKDELAKFKATYGSRYQERYVELLCQKIENRSLLTLRHHLEAPGDGRVGIKLKSMKPSVYAGFRDFLCLRDPRLTQELSRMNRLV